MFLKTFYILIAVALLGYWSYHFVSKFSKNENNEAAPPTTISVSERIRSLGKITPRKPLSTTFKVKNTGNEPLIIYEVAADCKCTVPNWDKSPIMPGKYTDVTVTYDASSPGFFSKKAMINYNSSDGDYIILIQGEVL